MTHRFFTWRMARPSDFKAIVALQDHAMVELSAGHYRREDIQLALRTVTLVTEDLILEGHYFVLESLEGQIVGSGGWSQQTPHYAAHTSAAPEGAAGYAIVRAIYVSPEFARQGIGRTIMRQVEEDISAHGLTHVRLTATLPGYPLYRKIGYQEIERTAAVLEGGTRIELVEMEKMLPRTLTRAA